MEVGFQTQLEELTRDNAPIRAWVNLGVAIANAMIDLHRAHLALQRDALGMIEPPRDVLCGASGAPLVELLAQCRAYVEQLARLRRLHALVYDQILALTPAPMRKLLAKHGSRSPELL